MKKLLFILLMSFIGLSTSAQNIVLKAVVDQPISCHGNADGYIQADVTYPLNGDFVYTLTDDAGKVHISNMTGFFKPLNAGIYSVSARDMQFHTSNTVSDLEIIEPDEIKVEWTVEKYPTTGSNGELSINITGGTPVLQSYLTWWINGWTGEVLNDLNTNNFATNLDNLDYGVYQVQIEDDHGCYSISEFYFDK